VIDSDSSKEKKKPKEGDNVVEEAPADVPSLLELKRIYYELMIRYVGICYIPIKCVYSLLLVMIFSPQFSKAGQMGPSE
jgi:hypothetical protein